MRLLYSCTLSLVSVVAFVTVVQVCHKSYITISLFLHTFHTGVGSLKVYARGEKSCSDGGISWQKIYVTENAQSAPITFLRHNPYQAWSQVITGARELEIVRGDWPIKKQLEHSDLHVGDLRKIVSAAFRQTVRHNSLWQGCCPIVSFVKQICSN